MFRARMLWIPLFAAGAILLAACSDESEPPPRGAAGVTAEPGAGDRLRPGGGRVLPAEKRLELPKAPEARIAQKWVWQDVVDPELAPKLNWDFEKRLDAADWTAPVVLEAEGEPVTRDELEAWLYDTLGYFASSAYYEWRLATHLRERAGLTALEPLPREEAEDLARRFALAAGAQEDQVEALLQAQFQHADSARLGFAYRLETFRALYSGDWKLEDLEEPFQSYFRQLGRPEGQRETLAGLIAGQALTANYSGLQATAGPILSMERSQHLYTRWDHDDGLGGVATLVRNHSLPLDQGVRAPWEAGGELKPVTLDELRRDLPIAWSPADRRYALRCLVAWRLVRRALEADGRLPSDTERWDNYWEPVYQEVAPGLAYERLYAMTWGAPSPFDVRVAKQMQDYEKEHRGDEVLDPGLLETFAQRNRWNLDKWLFGGSVIVVPFADPLTGRSAGPEAEAAALEKLKRYRRMVKDSGAFEGVAALSVQELPPLPPIAQSAYETWYRRLKENKGTFSNLDRGGLMDLFGETFYDRWTRGTSLAEEFVKMPPGAIAGAWKGPGAWFLVRMHRGRASRPKSSLAELGLTVGQNYLEYTFWRWETGLLRGASIEPRP